MAKPRPLTAAILGVIIGLAVAVVLQQQGVWPLDKITVFLLPAAIGLIAIVVVHMGRKGSPVALTIALLITVPMAAFGATGFTTLNEVGQLNGGCLAQGQTSVPDGTMVTDSSKRDPFLIDPNGSLLWSATSPVVFMDYDWNIGVDIGGFQVPLDSGHEGNEGGSLINGGDIPNITDYAAARGIDISELRGVYKVGGQAADTCDGFAFIKLISDPFETLVSKIAAGLAVLLTIVLMTVVLSGRRRPATGPGAPDDVPEFLGDDIADVDGDGKPDAFITDLSESGGDSSGVAGPEDVDEIFTDGFESGDTSAWNDNDD